MRFLLHPTRVTPTAIRRPLVASKNQGGSVAVQQQHEERRSSTSTAISKENEETRKWGQHHCGSSCSCILRMDVTIDTDGVVTSANYTAKSILPKFNGKDKLFLSECTCSSLHRLARKSCAYQLHKTTFQITNNMHSSLPLKRHIVHTHKSKPQCYDLLHQTLFAVWHQRIPQTTTMSLEDDSAEDGLSDPSSSERTVWTPWWWATKTFETTDNTSSLFQQHLDRLEQPPEPKGPHRDWLSYVDEIQDNEMDDRWAKSA